MEFAMQQGSLSSPATFFASGFQASRVYCWHRPEAKDASRFGAVPRKGDGDANWCDATGELGAFYGRIMEDMWIWSHFSKFSKHVGIATLAWLRWRGRSRVEAGTGRGRMSRELMQFFDDFPMFFFKADEKSGVFFFRSFIHFHFRSPSIKVFFRKLPPMSCPEWGCSDRFKMSLAPLQSCFTCLFCSTLRWRGFIIKLWFVVSLRSVIHSMLWHSEMFVGNA